jgi:pimeloyl-ACP methyl ester carboxylesterase
MMPDTRTPDAVAAPEWFTRSLAVPSESHYVDVDGAAIHYISWNAHEAHKPGLLFAHGFRAHARWWSFIAPFFLDRFRVASLDFGGMGESGKRTEYLAENYSRDIVGVIAHAKFDRPAVVGHSFGGARVLRACADHPDRIGRAIIVDTHLHLQDGAPTSSASQLRRKKIYPTYAAARARFRLIPPQNRAAPYILDYVAEHSIKRVDGGWTWKFDETPPTLQFSSNVSAMLTRIDMPVTYIYGDDSAIVPHQHAQEIVSHIPNCRGPIAIPDSHHHVLLDQPLSLIAALRGLLY